MNLKQIKENLEINYINGAMISSFDDYEYQIVSSKELGITYYYAAFLLDKSIDKVQKHDLIKSVGFLSDTHVTDCIEKNNVILVGIKTFKNESFYIKLRKVIKLLKTDNIDILHHDIFGKKEILNDYTKIKIFIEHGSDQVVEGLVIPVSKDSFNQYYDLLHNEIISEVNSKKNLFKSFCLMIVFIFIGILPLYFLYDFGYLSFFNILVLPLLGYYGYKLGKGPYKGYIPSLIYIGSLVLILIILIIKWAQNAYKLGFNLFDYIFKVQEGIGAVYVDFIAAILYLFVGVFLFHKMINHSTTSNKLKMLDNKRL